jgi:hypothetical protein
MASKKKNYYIAFVLLLVVGAVIYILPQLGRALGKADLSSEIALPILAIAGLVILLVVLTLTAIAFSMVDLSDKTQALALPEGSVRAVIALGLIVLLAIISVYLYGSLAKKAEGIHELQVTKPEEMRVLQARERRADSEIEIITISPSPDTSPSGPYRVFYVNRGNRDASEFAKQLFILIGTLVTSVASFYFGTRAVASVQSWPSLSAAPVITAINPQPISTTSPAQVTVLGSNLDLTQDVRLVQGTSKALAGTLVQVTHGAVLSSFRLDNTMTGDWEVVIGTSDGQNARFPIKLV